MSPVPSQLYVTSVRSCYSALTFPSRIFRSDSMRHSPTAKPSRLVTRLLAGLLFATMAVSLDAHAASVSRPGRGFGPVYDAAHETTFEGTIQEVVLRHTPGTAPGMHLMIAGPKGLVDAHIGPFMSKETKQVLQPGVPVRIVGANTELHGKTIFMA